MFVFTVTSFAPFAVIIAPSMLGLIILCVIRVLPLSFSSYITSFFVSVCVTFLVPPSLSVSSVFSSLLSSLYTGTILFVSEYVIITFTSPTPFILLSISSNSVSIVFFSVEVCSAVSSLSLFVISPVDILLANFLFASVVCVSFPCSVLSPLHI